MNRSDLIDEVAREALGGDKRAARAAIRIAVDSIQRALAEGERVQIADLGTFTPVKVPARKVRNPRTGELVKAAKTARVRFHPAKILRAYIAGTKKVPKDRPLV